MSLTFEIKGPLPEHAIRHVIREAEAGMADGTDPKAALVVAAQNYFAEQHAQDIMTALVGAQEMADMMGTEADIPATLADVKAQLGAEFDPILAGATPGDRSALAWALAKAVVDTKAVLPMNRGKWLGKLGIVKAHIDALVPATTTPAPLTEGGLVAAPAIPPPPLGTHGSPELDADAEKLIALGADPGPTDHDLAVMLGLDAPATEVLPPPPPFVEAASVASAVLLPPTSAGALSAAPPGLDAPPPPPETVNPRDGFILFGEATEIDTAALAERLGISRSTAHNYITGKTARVKITGPQARTMVSEIDVRVSKMRRAAEIFSLVRD